MHHVEIKKYSSLIPGPLKSEKPSIAVIICVQTGVLNSHILYLLKLFEEGEKKLAVLAFSPDSFSFWNKQSVLLSHFIVS